MQDFFKWLVGLSVIGTLLFYPLLCIAIVWACIKYLA